MHRALFLDYDGVLHPTGGALRDLLDPQKRAAYIERLKRKELERFCWLPALGELIAHHADVALFVHSSWRLDRPAGMVLVHLRAISEGRVVDVTSGENRYRSILDAVADRGIETYRILDDMPSQFPAGCPELVVCPPHEGVTNTAVRSGLQRWLEASRVRRVD